MSAALGGPERTRVRALFHLQPPGVAVADDAAITGTCKPAGGDDSPAFTVVVQGAHASWGYDVLFRGQTSHVGFEADILSAAAMKGLLTLGGNKPSPFTAAKS